MQRDSYSLLLFAWSMHPKYARLGLGLPAAVAVTCKPVTVPLPQFVQRLADLTRPPVMKRRGSQLESHTTHMSERQLHRPGPFLPARSGESPCADPPRCVRSFACKAFISLRCLVPAGVDISGKKSLTVLLARVPTCTIRTCTVNIVLHGTTPHLV